MTEEGLVYKAPLIEIYLILQRCGEFGLPVTGTNAPKAALDQVLLNTNQEKSC